jgi:8-oxo-dGTP pyrophosphatase MutT (NUDIX family)
MEDVSDVSRSLSRLVAAHRAADAEEGRHRDHVLRFLAEAKRPMDRNVYEPGHITGSAFVVSEDGRRVLLIHHAKLKKWMQPGGHVEAGETDACEVARREAQEEVGVRTAEGSGELLDVDVHTIPARGEQPEHFHFDLRYLFLVPAGEIAAADEVLDAKWFELAEAEAMEIDPGVRRMIRKVRERFGTA